MSEVDQRLEQLTLEALESAKQGRWGEVTAAYARRSQGGGLGQVSTETAQKLLTWDKWIVERVKHAQGALQQQILDTQSQRRKLAGMRRQYGSQSSSVGSLHHLQTI